MPGLERGPLVGDENRRHRRVESGRAPDDGRRRRRGRPARRTRRARRALV